MARWFPVPASPGLGLRQSGPGTSPKAQWPFTRAERTAQPLPKWPAQLQSRKTGSPAGQSNSTKSVPEQVPDTITCVLQGFQVDLQPLVGQDQVEQIKRRGLGRGLGRGSWRLQRSLRHHAGAGLGPTPLTLRWLHPVTITIPDICITLPMPHALLLALFQVLPTTNLWGRGRTIGAMSTSQRKKQHSGRWNEFCRYKLLLFWLSL